MADLTLVPFPFFVLSPNEFREYGVTLQRRRFTKACSLRSPRRAGGERLSGSSTAGLVGLMRTALVLPANSAAAHTAVPPHVLLWCVQ